MSWDARVDAYISRQAEFAGPILEHLRQAVHAACPEAEETIKWGHPFFLYRGALLAHMAAFKSHASFGFWRGGTILREEEKQPGAMGQFGRITSVADLPTPDVLRELIHKAVVVAETGLRRELKKAAEPPAKTPEDLEAALTANPAAAATFASFSPSSRREYVEWVVQAKRPDTRSKRIAQAVEWMAEGKKRNWKYENC